MLKRLLLATTALFSLSAVPAYAMPALAAGLPALLGGGLAAGGLSAGGMLLGVVAAGAQWLIGKALTPEQKQRGVKGKIEMGGDKPPKFILGEYATPGMLAYRNTLDKGSNIPEACLVDDICLSAMPITGVSTKVFIGNEGCHLNAGSNWNGFMEVDEYIKGGDDGGYCLMKFNVGNQNNADNWMLGKFGNDPDRPFTNNTYLPGCGEAIVQSWYSNRGIWSGWPEFRFVVRGMKLYDPRKDSTVGGSGPQRWGNENTWEFTKNPKVIEYNIIRGIRYDGDRVWGGDAEAYRLPLEYWFAAMNVCDEPVTKKNGDVIKRYEIGCEISFDDKPIDIINEINKSCDGYTTEFGGTYKTWCGGPGLAVGTITDDDWIITAELETTPFQPRQNTFNTCYTTYPEPAGRWEVKDGPRFQDADALAEDGEELAIDLALPFVTENHQAQRLARSAIRDSRRQLTHAGQLPPIAWIYEPFDRLIYVSEMFGYLDDGKDFVVASKDDLPNVCQQILLREINPGDTGWLPAYEQDFEAPVLDVVKPGALALDLNVFADQVDGTAGKDKPAIRAEWSWGGADIDVKRVEWELRRAGTTKAIKTGSINKPVGNSVIISPNVLRWGKSYEICFTPIPYAIRDSVTTGWKTVTMSAVDVPTALSLSTIIREGKDGKVDVYVRANWNDVAQETDGYGVKITIDGDVRYRKADGSRYEFLVKAPETVQVEVRTRAADGGTASDWCSPVVINVLKKPTGPGVATGVDVTPKPNVNVVDWDRCTDDDYKESIVYRSTANVFASATEIGRVNGNRFRDHKITKGVRYYYWVVHVNRSDNPSASASSSNFGDAAAIGTSDIDTTPPSGSPSGISIFQSNLDVDKDATVDIALRTTFSVGVAGAAGYEVEWVDDLGQVASTRADTGSWWFKAVTVRSYRARWRAVNSFGIPGPWSSYSGWVTPVPKTALPTAPTGFYGVGTVLGLSGAFNASPDLDYAYTEIGIGFLGSPGDSQVIYTTSFRYWACWWLGSGTPYARHVNTSGGKSAWVASSLGATSASKISTGYLDDNSITRAKLVAGAAGAIAHQNVGTGNSGSVNPGAGYSAYLLILSGKATSNTAGVTLNLGGYSKTIDYVSNGDIGAATVEFGSPPFAYSKSGGGTQANMQLIAVGLF